MFVARVVIDSGEGWGKGPAHVVIEEPLQNVPEGQKEADVATMAGTSCYFHLEAGERYVIITSGPNYAVGGCSSSFRVRGNEHILDALRAQVKGESARIVGTVARGTGAYSQGDGIAGALITASADGAQHKATTDGFGHYMIAGLSPGRYTIELSRPGFVPDEKYNQRWSGRLTLDQEKNVLEPDKTAPGTVVVTKGACAVWDLAMWAVGSIGGTVRAKDGAPLNGVTVQAFGFDARGRESNPLRTAKTSGDGSYVLQPLPQGRYVVGVNASRYDDEDAYPPTLYANGAEIHLAESATQSAVDLVLPPPRTPAKLHVLVVGPDGAREPGAVLRLDNLEGQRRGSYGEEANVNGEITAMVYVGEHYVVHGFEVKTGTGDSRATIWQGDLNVEITGAEQSATVVLHPKQ